MNKPIGVQLYSVRLQAAKDLPGVLNHLRDMGFKGVELAGLHGRKPAEFRQLVKDTGMEIISSHVPFPSPSQSIDTLMEEQQALGVRDLVVSCPSKMFQNRADFDAEVNTVNVFAKKLAAAGMTLHLHNHAHEFSSRLDGQSGFECLLANANPSIHFELDLYWLQTGGGNAQTVAAQAGQRIHFLHVKDGPCVAGEPMTALGQGKVNIPAALSLFPWVPWHIIEIDACAGDMMDALRESIRYLEIN
ncbi:MAG: sugar phosphate isomerase/epimerase [Verrucomicrobiae bacterium]|nr:sugar phosphate isomerase/epimerase [Verrucomicrobiae bacterium]